MFNQLCVITVQYVQMIVVWLAPCLSARPAARDGEPPRGKGAGRRAALVFGGRLLNKVCGCIYWFYNRPS